MSGIGHACPSQTPAADAVAGGIFRRALGRLARRPAAQGLLDGVIEAQLSRLRHGVLNTPGVRTVLVTSALDGEGKTVVAAGLARTIAGSLDHTALLIETDLRRPRMAEIFGLPPRPGIADHILDGIPLASTIRATAIPKLSVIACGRRSDASADVVASQQMRAVAEEVRNRYADRFVIFDAPPTLATPESLSLSVLVDGIIFVVQAETTPRALVRQALALLPREKVLGLVLNRVRLRPREVGYYDARAYGAAAAAERPT